MLLSGEKDGRKEAVLELSIPSYSQGSIQFASHPINFRGGRGNWQMGQSIGIAIRSCPKVFQDFQEAGCCMYSQSMEDVRRSNGSLWPLKCAPQGVMYHPTHQRPQASLTLVCQDTCNHQFHHPHLIQNSRVLFWLRIMHNGY